MDKVKAKIQELCPDVKSKAHESKGGNLRCHNCGESDNYDNRNTCKNGKEFPITLEVVLRAIAKGSDKTVENGVETITVDITGRFSRMIVFKNGGFDLKVLPCRWNLEHDNYDDQDRPTQLFIGSLLGV